VIPVEEALEIVLREARPLPAEEVSLEDTAGRVLAEDVRSDLEMPPFDRAAMDGFAVRAADVASAPATLEIVGEVPAGAWPDREVGPGEAVRIMTGAPVPPGADAVQQVEKTRPADEFRVTILEGVAAGANVAPRASEVKLGDVLLETGRVLDPAAVAVLAAAGCARVRVARRPSVAVLVTGDELVEVAATPGPGQIRNSNGPAVAAQAREAGAAVRLLGVAPDELQALRSALESGADADMLVISGGVSAGDFDLVEPALEELGYSFLFTKVAVKPGAPLVLGRRGSQLVFGLPGNPVSAQVTCSRAGPGPLRRRTPGGSTRALDGLGRPRRPCPRQRSGGARSGPNRRRPRRDGRGGAPGPVPGGRWCPALERTLPASATSPETGGPGWSTSRPSR
jgi:molybdopterin molybdotransferase